MENQASSRNVMTQERHAGGPAGVGMLLKQHRIRARLTQAELAGLSTVSVRTIRNLEAGRGQNPRYETVRLLADGLQLGPRAFESLNAALGKGPRGATLSALVSKVPATTRFATSHLLGRQNEVNSALAAIRSGSARVITLGGFGGVGKSRLAFGIVQAAKARFSMDWLWVPPATASASGATGFEGSPADRFALWTSEFASGGEAAVDDLVAMVAAQPFLLVLDDLQQYSPRHDALLTDILQRCPRLVVIETTRRMVEQTSRVMMPVKPLALETSTEADDGQRRGRSFALELLLSHALTSHPHLEIAEKQSDSFNAICSALDGLPRAIENAVSWLGPCSPSQVADMTRSDPFTIGGGNPGNGPDHWAYDALADAINCLQPSHYTWLERLSAEAQPWSLEEAATMMRQGPLETAKFIYRFFTLGLIRPVGAYGGEPKMFTALNHVKSFLA